MIGKSVDLFYAIDTEMRCQLSDIELQLSIIYYKSTK